MAKRKPKNTQGSSSDGFWATHKKQAKLSYHSRPGMEFSFQMMLELE